MPIEHNGFGAPTSLQGYTSNFYTTNGQGLKYSSEGSSRCSSQGRIASTNKLLLNLLKDRSAASTQGQGPGEGNPL